MAGNVELGAAIGRARDAREWSQPELARRSKLKQTTLSNYELGKRDVPTAVLSRIATALGMTTDELLGRAKPDDQVFVGLQTEWGFLTESQRRELRGFARVMHAENDEAARNLDLSGLDESEREAVMTAPADVRPMIADTMRRSHEIRRVSSGGEDSPVAPPPRRRASRG